MSTDKFRKRVDIRGNLTVAGSAGFQGTTTFSGPVTFAAAATLNGNVTLGGAVTNNAALTINTPTIIKVTSSPTQFAGLTRVGCNVATAVISSTMVKSNMLFFADYRPAPGTTLPASAGLAGPIVVQTFAHGAWATLAFASGAAIKDVQVDISWKIELQP